MLSGVPVGEVWRTHLQSVGEDGLQTAVNPGEVAVDKAWFHLHDWTAAGSFLGRARGTAAPLTDIMMCEIFRARRQLKRPSSKSITQSKLKNIHFVVIPKQSLQIIGYFIIVQVLRMGSQTTSSRDPHPSRGGSVSRNSITLQEHSVLRNVPQ
jgi:hypothetical protein